MGTQRKRVKTLRTAVTALSVFGQFRPETAQAAACDSAACLGDKMIRRNGTKYFYKKLLTKMIFKNIMYS
jgi:hypothetical protein